MVGASVVVVVVAVAVVMVVVAVAVICTVAVVQGVGMRTCVMHILCKAVLVSKKLPCVDTDRRHQRVLLR